MKKILIVESYNKISLQIKEKLNRSGITFLESSKLQEALTILNWHVVDIVIIENRLVGKNKRKENGLRILKEIRKRPEKYRNPYLIVLNDDHTLKNKREAYLSGANVYFDSKLEFDIFIIALKAQLKYGHILYEIIRYEKLILNIKSSIVKYEGLEFHISNSEFIVLVEILRHQGEWLAKKDLMKCCWGNNSNLSKNLLPTTVCRLKRKFSILEKNLTTKRFQGYYLNKIKHPKK